MKSQPQKRIKITVALAFFCSFAASAQHDPQAVEYAKIVAAPELRENLSIIAADALEGRETGSRGQKMAAAFIAHFFEGLGLQGPVDGSFYQAFNLYAPVPGDIYVRSGETYFRNLEQVAYSGTLASNGEQTLPVVFIGRGAEQDLAQIDVKGKAVVKISSNSQPAGTQALLEKGALKVFVVGEKPEDFPDAVNRVRRFSSRMGLSLKPGASQKSDGTFYLSHSVVEKIFGMPFAKLLEAAGAEPARKRLSKIKSGTITYNTAFTERVVKTENVLGYLEGTDKKDELVIITAHYDHIGKRRSGEGDLINNGADDDGSGTVAVMQLAKAFARAKADGKGPRRSMLFMTVTGEELGLFGSQYYTDNPVFPLEKTMVNLNMDMIGRSDNQVDTTDYVYVIGADKLSADLHTLSERVNSIYTNLRFDYTYNDENHPDRLYYRSDHWNFAKNNIPIIFYFDGIHEDYHRVTDEVSKIDFPLLEKRARCVFHTAWVLANRETPLKLNEKK